MNLRTPLILFGVLLGLIAVFFGLQFFGYQTPVERKESEKYLLPALHKGKDKFATVPAADFSQVTIERTSGDGKPEVLEFKRKSSGEGKSAGAWELVGDRKLRISTRAVDNLIEQIADAQKDPKADLSSDLSAYGLDKPTAKVTLIRELKDKEGNKTGTETHVVTLGSTSPHKVDPQIYVLTSHSPKKPVAVAKNRLDRALAPLNEFRDKDLLGSSLNVTGVRLGGTSRKPLELSKSDGRDWRFVEPKIGDADPKSADDLVNALSGIRVEKNDDFVADLPPNDAKLAEYGLSEDGAPFVVTFKHKGDSQGAQDVTLLIGQRDAKLENQAAIGRAAQLIAELAQCMVNPVQAASPVAAMLTRESEATQTRAYYARLKGDGTVVRIDGKHIKVLERKPDELRSRSLARLDASKVDAIDLKAGGETLRFRRPQLKSPPRPGDPAGGVELPSEWEVHTDQRAAVKAHLDTVTKLIDAANKIELPGDKNFLDDDAKQREWFGKDPLDLGLDQPRAELAFWQDAIQRDKDGKPEGSGEPKLKDAVKDKPALSLAIGRKDEKRGVVYVRRQVGDGQPAVLAVPDPWLSSPEPTPPAGQFGAPSPGRERIALSELATAGYLYYRDHVLPSFKTNDVTKLTYTRGGITYELEKDVKPDGQGAGWKLKQPVEGKGASATDMLIFSLARMQADKLLTDRASDRDRKEKFGLVDAPLLRCTVTTQEKDKKETATYTYVIGKPAESEKGEVKQYYARIEVKPATGSPPDANDFVFLVPSEAVQFLDTELRDVAIFTADPKVRPQSVTLTWHDAAMKNQTTKLELTYAPDKEGSSTRIWTVKSLVIDGKDAGSTLPKLDTARLDRLFGISSGLPRVDTLMTERFVLHKGKPEAAWRLDPASKEHPPALILQVKYDDNSSRTIVFGANWPAKKEEMPGLRHSSYFLATASTVPDAVFLVSEPDFKELVAGVKFFKSEEKVSSLR